MTLTKRVIPCLDVANGRVVKGLHFKSIKDAGDPVSLAEKYSNEGADELVFLDITASEENREIIKSLVSKVAQVINIPFTVGGGVKTLQHARDILLSGADKVAINTGAVKNPKIITELMELFGRQCIVVAVDVKRNYNIAGQKNVFTDNDKKFWFEVFIYGGKKETGIDAIDWVKKMESEGIGRPSTYAPTISTIQDRGYVEVTPEKRLKPTSIGEVVTDFLTNHFSEIVNLGFTAKIERNFDRIANGEENWVEMIANFYQPFHQRVGEKDESVTRAEVLKRRELGTDPESGKPVSVSIGKFGPMVQIGTREDEEKPRFASLPSNLNLNEVTFEEAMECFALPLTLGTHESGEEIIVNNGRYGPYVRLGKDFFSLPKGEDPLKTNIETALEIIREGLEKKAKSTIHDFGEIRVIDGRFGPYIKSGKSNYKIPKGVEPETLDEAACLKIIAETPPSKGRKGGKRKFTKKEASA